MRAVLRLTLAALQKALADAEHYRQRGDFKAARLHAVQYLCHLAMLEKLAILQGEHP